MKINKLKVWIAVFVSVVVLSTSSSAVFAAEAWFQDNSFGKGRTLPDDFTYKFENSETWERAINDLDVYMFRVNIFSRANFPLLTDTFITESMTPVLKENNIKIALNTAGPLGSGCKNRSARINKEFEWISRMKGLGVSVDYVSLQSILSKPFYVQNQKAECSLEDRVNGAISYAQRFSKVYPAVEFGLIDALPSHGKAYKEAYKYIRDRFKKEKMNLGFIHLDLSAEMVLNGRNGLSWQKIIEVEKYVKKLGLQFGMIFTSRKSGQISDEAFYKVVATEHRDYMNAGGDPDHKIITSWFPFPKQSVRRRGDMGGYPMTDLIWEFQQFNAKSNQILAH